jgi:glycosyltransferase involved in cell wall biosynthesis
VNATLPQAPVGPVGPRKDYVALAEALNATVLDHPIVDRRLETRLVARVFGVSAAQAWLAFRQRHAYDAIFTDGEHIGILLALLLKLARASTRHVTIGHRLSAAKKRPFFRWLKVHTHIDRIVVHSRLQYELAISELGIPARQVALLPYQVDTSFWRPQPVAEAQVICSAGLEFRDYPTLFRAVDGLDTHVVVAAASHWSRRPNTAAYIEPPPNVEVGALDYCALRDLYARSALVVVPLEDVDFQAGVTTILEAMSMGKAVVVTHSQGQTDMVEDRRAVTRGALPRPRPVSMLQALAEQAGLPVEPNGFYVLPGDPGALRRAIVYLLEHPAERARLGEAGRRAVERLLTVDQFAARLQKLVEDACSAPTAGSPTLDLPRTLAMSVSRHE